MSVTINSQYSGEVLDKILVKATTENELVEGGYICIIPNVLHKIAIPRLKVGRVLQKRKEMPKESDAKGDFNIDEKYLEPKDFMVFAKFNPRTFEHIWRPFQPKGPLVFSELPPEVQNKLLEALGNTVSLEMGYEIINGEYADSEGKFFDGILTRITNDVDVLKVLNPVTITAENIIDKLKAVVSLIPTPLKGKKLKKNTKIFMSIDDWELYDYNLTEKPHKGVDYSKMSEEKFKGFEIVALADWPKDVIVAAYATSKEDSNLFGACGYVNDTEVIQIDKLTNAGELYFFKMLMKFDTNVAFGEEAVLYDGR